MKKLVDFVNTYEQKICLALLSVVLLVVTIMVSTTIKDTFHVYGDSGAEACTLMASRHYVTRGFVETRFLPVHNSGEHLVLESPEAAQQIRSWTYTRYPDLPDLIAGVTTKLGATEMWHYRITPMIFNIAAIICLYLLVYAVIGNCWLALLTATLFTFNYSFVKMFDSFHFMGYAELLRFVIPLLFWKWWLTEKSTRKTVLFWSVFALSIVNIQMTFDYVIHTAIMMFFLGLFFLSKEKTFALRLWDTIKKCFPFFMAAVIGFALKIAQNAWYYGAIQPSLEEFGLSLLYRIFNYQPGGAPSPVYFSYSDLYLNTKHLLKHHFGFQWGYLGMFMAFFFSWGIYRSFKNDLYKKYFIFFAILTVANWSYMALLLQWTLHHFGLAGSRHIVPMFALFVAGGLFFPIYELRLLLQRFSYKQLVIVLVLAGTVAWPSIRLIYFNVENVFKLWAAHDTTYSWKDRVENLSLIEEQIPEKAVILGNMTWRPEARYVFNRYCQIVENMDHLRNVYDMIPANDRYFVFLERWGDPDDGFFPNYRENEAELMALSRELQAWLDTNAVKTYSRGKWHVYKLTHGPAK
jgi:hypothetical protein